jgi:hypothetical protein
MPNWFSKQIDNFRGTLRVGQPLTEPESTTRDTRVPGDLSTPPEIDSTQSGSRAAGESSVLDDYKKLIPGEALAAYIALQALAEQAENPVNVSIVLAISCCLLTIFLRWVGTQDRVTRRPQYWAVLFAAVAFVLLVYAAGGQIFWHQKITDQQFYAQIFATVLGVIVPLVYGRFAASD